MSSNKNWILQVDSVVYKFVKKIPLRDAERILLVMEGIEANPFEGDVQKMKGEESSWRRRIGAYRIFYEIIAEEKVIHIFLVERRTSNTY